MPRPLIIGQRAALARRVAKYRPAARGIAEKLAHWCPERIDDLVQAGLTAACGVRLAGVRNPDAYIRQAMKYGMITHLRREAALEQRRDGRRCLGNETYCDDIPPGMWGDPDEAYYDDRVHRADYTAQSGAYAAMGIAPAAVDDAIDCARLLNRLPHRDRALIQFVYGLRPVPGHALPGRPRLAHIGALLGLGSEANVRYHRDRILRQLRSRHARPA